MDKCSDNDSCWHSLNSNYQAKYECNGQVIVIRPKTYKLVVPLFCPICEFPLTTADDASTFREHSCCYKCDLYWRRSYITRWEDKSINDGLGWRPSLDPLFWEQWLDYLKRRTILEKPTIKFK
jgi:hypothetical protein